ncbi:MAG: class I SAM-dependent methyltransferase family protein [Nitrososphaerota archaeon]|nr:class I SAM-dependent methyltransferase family protein [Nitrososphaerota archaeon]
MNERYAIKVPKERAENLKRKLSSMGILDAGYKPIRRDEWIYFPVKGVGEELEKLVPEYGAEIEKTSFEPRILKPRSLKESLKDVIPKDLLTLVPSSYDLIGDLILIELPNELEGYSRIIGETLMKLHPRVKSVLAKGETIGEYRVRRIRVIAGSQEAETIHREHGCLYRLDLRKAFFNPRFSGERLRVAEIVKPGEDVLDMFAGVGPFSILIAKKCPGCRVTAIELNPDAYHYLVQNIRLNKVEGLVTAIHGNAREVLRSKKNSFDRVIMDLPHNSVDFLDLGLEVCRPQGIIHLYVADTSIQEVSEEVEKRAASLGHSVVVEFAREVMAIAPRRYTMVLDLRKRC